MNEDELRALYAERMRAQPATDAAPDPEVLRRVARGEATEAERLRVLDAVMQSEELRREYDTFRALAAGGRRRALGPPAWVGLAAAMLIAVYAGSRWWNGQSEEPTRGSGSEITLIQPAAGADAGAPQVLVWRSVRSTRQYEIEIRDAGGATVRRATAPDTTITLADPALGPGDYRWSVAARRLDGSVVRSGVGRFTVR